MIKRLFGEVTIGALIIAFDREEVAEGDKSACEVFEDLSGVKVIPILKISEVFDFMKKKNEFTDEQINSFRNYFKQYGSKSLKEKFL